MTPTEIIKIWQTGCSCADIGKPEQYEECTDAMINALKREMLDASQYEVKSRLREMQNDLDFRIADNIIDLISKRFDPLKI